MNQIAEHRTTGDRPDRSGSAAGSPSSAMATEQSQARDVSSQDVGEEAKQVATQVAGQARELVSSQVSRRAERSAGDIRNVAEALRQTNKQLEGNIAAPLVEKAADQLERFSQYLRTASAQDVVRSAERFARREPLLFLGGAFALGILSARFLKSSAQHTGISSSAGSRDEPAGRRTEVSSQPGAMGRTS